MSVILDFGSSSFKLGHSSQEKPSLIIPSFYENGANDYVPGENIGQDGQIIQAVKNCEIVNQDRILSILSATIDDLAGNDDDLNIALTDNPTASEKNTVFFSQLFFEDMEASAVCIKPSCLAVADNLKIETGLILDIGHDKSYAYPREHCFIPAHAIKSTFFGGSIIDDYEIALLSYKSPLNWKEYQRIENIKHDMIVSPFRLTDEELEQLNPIQMLEKSGSELLFDKEYLDLTFSGDYPPPKVNRLYEECTIPELIASSISACDIGLRRELWEQIIIIGGIGEMEGLSTRLFNELKKNAPAGIQPLIQIVPNPSTAAWCALAKTDFQHSSHVVTREKYLEDPDGAVRIFRS